MEGEEGREEEGKEREEERRGEGRDTEKGEVREEEMEKHEQETTTRSSLNSKTLPFQPRKQSVHCSNESEEIDQIMTLDHSSDHCPPTLLESSLHTAPPGEEQAVEDSSVHGVEYCSRSQLREHAQRKWEEHVVERIGELLEEGNPLGGGWGWRVWPRGVVRVKSYAPFVDHLVADVECRPVMD